MGCFLLDDNDNGLTANNVDIKVPRHGGGGGRKGHRVTASMDSFFFDYEPKNNLPCCPTTTTTKVHLCVSIGSVIRNDDDDVGSTTTTALLRRPHHVRRRTLATVVITPLPLLEEEEEVAVEEELLEASAAPKRVLSKAVQFSKVEVREYNVVIGDDNNPINCPPQGGIPLSLGWEYNQSLSISVNDYEDKRVPCRRHDVDDLSLSRAERWDRLKTVGGVDERKLFRTERKIRVRELSQFFGKQCSLRVYGVVDYDQQVDDLHHPANVVGM